MAPHTRLPLHGNTDPDQLPAISVIIPALDEEAAISSTVAAACAPGVKVMVVDGGSGDQTAAMARQAGAKVITAPKGRARQMNAGAGLAQGTVLLFLHADTLLPEGWQHEVIRVLSTPGTAAGAFSFRLDHRSASLRLIELGVALRCRWSQLPYGDQALFMTRRMFQRVGGYPELPIMEDVELIKALRRHGRIAISPAPAITSARRWQKKGALYTTLHNFLILFAFYAGFKPATLRRIYDEP